MVKHHWFDLSRHDEDPPAADPVDPPADPQADPPADPPKPHEDKRITELRQERARRQTAEQERADALAKVKEYEDRDKSETEKLTERTAAAEKALADANGRLMRSEVAIDKGLPKTLADRLQGGTREEMEADADALLALIPTAPAPPAPPSAAGVGNTGKPPAPTNFRDADKAELRAELRKFGVRLP